MIRRFAVLVVALLFTSGGSRPPLAVAAEPSGFIFRPGDRVVFLGDSITEQYQYSTYIELYLTTRFPKGNMTFHNAGIGGDTATGGARRFATHVLAEKPTAVTIDFGMNDGGYGAFDAKRAEQYLKTTERMLEAAKNAGVRVALISPNAVEVRGRPNLKTYLETQAQFYAPLKDIAAKFDVPFVDQYAVTRKVLEKMAADNAKVKPFPDGVHTSPAGGLLMAHTILVGLHAPAEVSRFEVYFLKPSMGSSHCEIANPRSFAGRTTFDRTDDSLPLPIPKDWRELLPYVDHLKDLNDYGLKIGGLTAGKYELTIDDKPVATYTADELAAGVNIGNAEKGPIHDQGMKVLAAINAKNEMVHKRFRGVVMADGKNVDAQKRQDDLAKLEEQIAAKQAEVYKLAAPVKHHWVVKPAE